MSTNAPIVIRHSNLSLAWAKAFLRVAQPGPPRLEPLVVTIGGFDAPLPSENQELRLALDEHLSRLNSVRIDATAMTIFPYKPWIRKGRPAYADFRDYCLSRLLPRLKKLDQRNRNGTYFERMMAYTGDRRNEMRVVDQVGFIITLLRGDRRARESALQIGCFDPAKDHTGQPVRGFPRLQQIGVSYGDDDLIAMNAFYPTQYIFDRAYGNYLGLCQLGHLLAHETGLPFARLNCFVGKPELGDVNKGDLESLVALCTTLIDGDDPAT